jgi:RecB family exonuclease
MERLTTWSYSRYSTYTQCPKKAKYLYIDKLKEESSEALEKGSRIHKEMEEYLALNMPVPRSADLFSELLMALKKEKATPEEMWGLTKEFKDCSPWDSNVWLRGKLDAYFVKGDKLTIIDFKTGKDRPKNMDQLELYAIMGFAKFPKVEVVEVQLWYLDSGTFQSHNYSTDQVDHLILQWRGRIEPYLKDETFRENPSRLCGWCGFSKGKGGPCIY